MVNETYKTKVHNLVQRAKEKGLVKSYKEFCKTDIAKNSELSKEEIAYYTSKREDI